MNIYLRQGFFFYLLPAFLMGVMLESLSFHLLDIFYLLLIVSLSLAILAVIRRQPIFFFISLIVFGFSLGLWRTNGAFPPLNTDLEKQIGQSVVLEGTVASDLDERDSGVNFYLKLEEKGDLVLVSTALGLETEYGDSVKVTGNLSEPVNFQTDTGKTFDYVHYLETKSIHYIVKQATVEVVESGEWSLQRFLFRIKNSFVDNLKAVLPDPEVSLASGLLVGDKAGMGPDWQDAFRRAGIIHIVVLSGYNITIIAENVLRLFVIFMPRFVALGFSSMGIILFAMMVGGGATVIRASIMALLVVVARLFGRDYQIGYALALACFLMVFHRPLILVFDVGFQLSFLATVGLVYGSPLITTYLTKIPERFGLRDILASTLAPQLFVLPWLIYTIGQVSIVAPIVNVLVLPVVPAIMLATFVTGCLGFVSFIVSLPVGIATLVGLKYILLIVDKFTMFDFLSLTVSNFSLWLVVIWYFIYIWIFWREKNLQKISLGNIIDKY